MVESNFNFFKKQILNSIKFSFQRSLIIILAIFIGAMVSSSFLNIYFDIDSKMSKELKAYGANFTISPPKDGEYLNYKDYQDVLSKIPDISLSASSAFLYGTFNFGSTVGIAVGVELDGFKELKPFIMAKNDTSFNPNDFDNDDVAYIGVDLANILEINRAGQQIQVFNEKNGNKKTLTIYAIISSGDELDGLLITSLKNVQELLGGDNVIDYANAIVDGDFDEVKELAENISSDKAKASVITLVSLSEGIILEKIKGLMALVGIIILIISSTSVNTTLSSIILARKKEIALHMALGASKKSILKLFGWESFILAFISSLAGAICGYFFSLFLGKIVFDASIGFRFLSIILGVLCSMICSFVAAYFPIKKALDIDVADNLRGE